MRAFSREDETIMEVIVRTGRTHVVVREEGPGTAVADRLGPVLRALRARENRVAEETPVSAALRRVVAARGRGATGRPSRFARRRGAAHTARA